MVCLDLRNCVHLFPDLRSGLSWPNGCRKRGTVGFLCTVHTTRHHYILRDTHPPHCTGCGIEALLVVGNVHQSVVSCLWQMFRGTATVASTNQLIRRLMEESTGGQVFPSSQLHIFDTQTIPVEFGWETKEDYMILQKRATKDLKRLLKGLGPEVSSWSVIEGTTLVRCSLLDIWKVYGGQLIEQKGKWIFVEGGKCGKM